MKEDYLIQGDGGSRGNPGPAGAGAVVKDAHGIVVGEVSEYLGTATNNVAEYTALVRALELLLAKLGKEAGGKSVLVHMDSKLVIEQMKGAWKVKHPNMKPLATRALALASNFKWVTFSHIPREKNKHADQLANDAMDRKQ